MNLKKFLAESSTSQRPSKPAGFVPAPELGEDVTVPIRSITIGELKAVQAILADKTMDRGSQLRAVLSIVVCDTDGHRVYEPNDPAADLVDVPLAVRLIDAAMSASVAHSSADAKKPSPKTPS